MPCSDGAVYAISRANGSLVWRAVTGARPFNLAVGGGMVFLDSVDPESDFGVNIDVDVDRYGPGLVVALDSATGTERWRFGPEDQHNFITYHGGRLFVAMRTHAADAQVRLVALNAETGAEIWSARSAGFWGVPRVVDGKVFVGGATVAAFDETTGKEVWRSDRFAYGVTVAQGVVAGIQSYGTGAMFGLDAASGRPIWTQDFCDCASYTGMGANSLIFSGPGLAGLEPGSGQVTWGADDNRDLLTPSVVAPTITGGYIYVGSRRGNLYAFRLP